ncbi:MAG: PQQ-binding-like beta-propeller repeat protein [Planctomycetaceae bacterium]
MIRFVTFVAVWISLAGSASPAGEWPTYRGDVRRSGYTAEGWSGTGAGSAWAYRSPHRPQPAWPGPARWDSYANVRGLGAMRNYDPCFHVVSARGRVFFGSSADDSVHCLDARTGELCWTYTTDGPVRIAPTVAEGRVYCGSDDGCAYCVDAEGGTLVWKSSPADESQRILNNGRFVSLSPCRTGVLVEGSHAYFGTGLLPWRDAVLMSVDARSGKMEGAGCFQQGRIGLTMEGALLAGEKHLIAPAGRVAPYVFDRGDGRQTGQLEGSGGSSVVLTGDGNVLCGPGNKTGWISEANVESGKQIQIHQGALTAAVSPTHRVMVSKLRLSAADALSGRMIWDVPCRHHCEVIIAGDTVITGGEDSVAAFRLEDGRLLWEAAVQGRAFGLAVADGRLYASTDEGVIHCFIPSQDAHPAAVDEPARAAAGDEPGPAASSPHDRADEVRGLVSHWLVHREMSVIARRRGIPNYAQRLSDRAGTAHALIHGPVSIREVGGVEALELDGETNSISISDDLGQFAPPPDAFTAEAWVRIDEPDSTGGIIGCFEDSKTTHQGWMLGCRHARFLFAVAAGEGAAEFENIAGQTQIRPGHWYHVAATYDGQVATLSVNGVPEGRSASQHGPIIYPASGFYDMGLYHDSDSRHPLYGMLHEVRVYDRAVPAEDLARRHQQKRNRFRVPIELEAGPYVQFLSPSSARVRWQTAAAVPTRLVLHNGNRQTRHGEDLPRTEHEVVLRDLPHDRMLSYAIEQESAGDTVSTLEFELDTQFNFSTPDWPENARPFADAASSAVFEHAAQFILETSGVDQGICLVIGNGEGRLAWELARRSRLRVVCVDTDPAKVDAARRAYLQAGVYGSRIAAQRVESYAELPFVGRFANLIVSEDLLTGGRPIGDAAELLRVLRPNGGVICLGQPAGAAHRIDRDALSGWFAPAALDATWSDGPGGRWLTAVRPPLEGAGAWSHLYGRADNSAFGGETLGGASTTSEMDVQWIGRPGPRAQPDRNGRKPSPLSTNGRLFVQGLHRVIALDAFNGAVLWSLEVPALERFNMPRDCSNWCADDAHVYLAVKDRCWQVDAARGEVTTMYSVVPAERKDWSYDWGYIAQTAGQILGSAEKAESAFTSFWGDADAGWYDARSGPATFKVCSDCLFALSKQTGLPNWSYENGVIINSTITVSGDRVYFVESRSPTIKRSSSRRIGAAELWDDQFLVALDLQSGAPVWEQPIDTADGTVVFYLAEGEGTLVVNASTDDKFEVTAFQASDGRQLWRQGFGWFENKGDHGKAISRPAILGGRVYVRPKVLDLATGKILDIEMPGGKCGTYAATTNAMVFRTTEITLWNTESGSTSSWDRMRPDCWLSTIPAAGMLLSPEGGGGCSCGSWMEMSIGFMPRTN